MLRQAATPSCAIRCEIISAQRIDKSLPLNPTKPPLSQALWTPALQAVHSPSQIIGSTQTRSPTWKFPPQSSPTSSTTPLNSWPNVSGGCSPVMGCGVVGHILAPPRYLEWSHVMSVCVLFQERVCPVTRAGVRIFVLCKVQESRLTRASLLSVNWLSRLNMR